jgi:hypothetical protein
MPPHWIPAAQALSIVAAESSEISARFAICRQAHAGLLKARARLFDTGNESKENAVIPTSFWWADGHEALEQDWAFGEFSTWIDRTFHWQAHGVTFDFRGLRELLPPERAAVVARELSVAGNADWTNASDARAFVYNKVGAPAAQSGAILLAQCKMGFIAARAVLRQQGNGASPNEWSIEEREWDIPDWFWENFTAAESSNQDWERGIFSGRGPSPSGRSWITLTGVHFSRASLNAMLPPSKPERAESPVTTANLGRLPAAFWDELWCAIWGQIFRGEFQPNSASHVKEAMLQWASNNDHELSDSAAKPRARKLFIEYQNEGKK